MHGRIGRQKMLAELLLEHNIYGKQVTMTDKQIIIDEIDVSGCESFCNGICCKVGFGDDASCKLFSDCHYKNWKRKEQECEVE